MRSQCSSIFILVMFLGCQTLYSQDQSIQNEKEYYYLGINPIALFTGIRSGFTSEHLPMFTNMETGISVFGGKIWGDTYNVETRLSYGSPKARFRLFQVHSGFQFCFPSHYKQWNPYAGLFFRLYSLRNIDQQPDYVNTGFYASIGNRFNWSPFLLTADYSNIWQDGAGPVNGERRPCLILNPASMDGNQHMFPC